RVQELAEQSRSLHRRVIILQGESVDFHIPPAKLREAMIALLPSISAPIRKIKRINAALTSAFGQAQSHFSADSIGVCPNCGTSFQMDTIATASHSVQRSIKAKAQYRLPHPDDWSAILSNDALTDGEFQQWAGYQYHLNAVLAMYLGDVDS